jgi:hypothetical protein
MSRRGRGEGRGASPEPEKSARSPLAFLDEDYGAELAGEIRHAGEEILYG